MKKATTLLGLVLLLVSCASFSGAKMSRISPGMSKADVIRELGKPQGFGGRGNVEILHYVEDQLFYLSRAQAERVMRERES